MIRVRPGEFCRGRGSENDVTRVRVSCSSRWQNRDREKSRDRGMKGIRAKG